MTVILICIIAHLLIGYGILIVDALFLGDYIETEQIVICLFWSILLPAVVISKIRVKRKMKKFLKKG